MLVGASKQGICPVVQDEVRVIRLKELIKLIGLSRSTIYDRLNPRSKRFDPLFPKPLKLGESAIGWQLGDVLTWIGDLQPVSSIIQHKD
jgi:prophage regulatory protein